MKTLAFAVGVVTAADIILDAQQGECGQKGAAMPVNNRLGQTRGATGIDNPNRVIKRYGLWLESL